MTPKTKIIATAMVVAIVVFTAVGALMIFNKSPDLLNSEFRVIITDSMDGEPTGYEVSTIPVNSLIAIHKMDGGSADTVKIGDVIGFHSDVVNGNVYHRVISLHFDDPEPWVETKGDNPKYHSTDHVALKDINGKVAGVIPELGNIPNFVKQNFLLVIALLAAFAIAGEIYRYIKTGKELKE